MHRSAICAIPFLVFAAWGQSPPAGHQLTARELFYAAADQVAPKTPDAKPPAKPARAAEARTETRSAKRGRPERTTAPQKQAVPGAGGPASEVARKGGGAGAPYVPAAYTPGARSGVPLGLRYTILKLVDGRMVEVAPDSVFHAGDRIQVSLEANDAGYLYIVNQGSSGTWKPLFPSAEIEDGNNRIEKGRTYVMPPKSRFYFDEQAGEEKLFIVFSRQPEPDLEKLVYRLREGAAPPQAPAAPAPAGEPAAPARPVPLLLASNMQIQDSVVGRLRTAYARDLVIERVDDEGATAAAPAPGGRREKAVYVVNPTGGAESRVVADIRLEHR